MKKTPLLIVDGYNIIGSWENLKRLKEKDFGSARDQLVSALAAFYPWCWERIIVVFDGQNFAWDFYGGVEVVFTGANESADTLIERLAAGLAAGARVEVATSDFAELQAASNLGAAILSAPALAERLKAEREAFSERLARRNGGKSLNLNDLLQQPVIDSLDKLRKI